MAISGKKSDNLEGKQPPDVDALLEELKSSKNDDQFWENIFSIGGGPLFQKQDNGQYKVTFMYRAQNAEKVELESEDLHERILDENDEPRCFERIPGTDTFILQIENLPADAFCFYNIKVNGIVVHPEQDPEKTLSLHTINIPTSEEYEKAKLVSYEARYLRLPEALIPGWTSLNPKQHTHGSIKKDSFKDQTGTFIDRDIWVYKPEGFDPNDGKVVFILDGENFLKTLTPYLDTINQDGANPLANTAFVFIDSKMTVSGQYRPPVPDRVYEFYFDTERFSKLLAEQIIPKYCNQLQGDKPNPDNVILTGHSLAAYPVMNAAKDGAGIGGVILLSAAFNQNTQIDFSEQQNPEFSKIPIYMQIGKLESTIPPEVTQNSKHEKFRDMSNKSRFEANQDFHTNLKERKYTVQSSLKVHSSGHGGIHAVEGLVEGLQFLNSCHKKKV